MISELSLLVIYMLRSCMPGVVENGAIPSAHLLGGETDESIKDPATCIVLARAFIISHIMHASSFWQEFVLHPYYTIPPRFFLSFSVWSGLARWWRLSCLLGSELAPRAVMRSAVDGFWLWDKGGLLPTW
jgi:hypothetical protein